MTTRSPGLDNPVPYRLTRKAQHAFTERRWSAPKPIDVLATLALFGPNDAVHVQEERGTVTIVQYGRAAVCSIDEWAAAIERANGRALLRARLGDAKGGA